MCPKRTWWKSLISWTPTPQTPEQGLVRAVGTLPRLLPDEPQPEQMPREILSERVVSLNFRFYDADANEWLDTWDRTDMLPALVEITVGVAPIPLRRIFSPRPAK
jgi:hypothetical protein